MSDRTLVVPATLDTREKRPSICANSFRDWGTGRLLWMSAWWESQERVPLSPARRSPQQAVSHWPDCCRTRIARSPVR